MANKQTPRKLSAILQDAIDNHLEVDHQDCDLLKAYTLTGAIIVAAHPCEAHRVTELLNIIHGLVPAHDCVVVTPQDVSCYDPVNYVLAYQYAFGITNDWPNSRWFSHMFATSVIEYLKSIDK